MDKPVPVNLPALFGSFTGSVPSFIRKRGAELLKAMQDAAISPVFAVKTDPTLVDEDVIIADATPSSIVEDLPSRVIPSSASAVPVVGLWGATMAAKPSITAQRSSLFGNKPGNPKPQGDSGTQAKLAVGKSALFGVRPASTRLAGASSVISARKSIQDIHDSIINTSKKVGSHYSLDMALKYD